ncbi:MAG: YitT family protein, partial [Bacteroidales bacterium]|nr:YitT family protein [Bacteroidales bacterium]
MKIKIHDTVKDYTMMVVGCFLYSFGAVLFVEPYGFAPGGTYGLAMVFHHLWGWRTEVAALCMDIPLLVLGSIILGAKFGIKTLICTLLLPLFMLLVHSVYGYDALLD